MNLFRPHLFLAAMLFCCTAWSDAPLLFHKLEAALQANDQKAYMSLFAADPALQELETRFFQEYVAFQATRTVLQLADSKDNRMRIHILMQAEEEAKFESWSIESAQENGAEVILSRDVLSTISGLYRLRLSPKAYRVQDVEVRHYDSIIRLKSGSLFPILTAGEMAGALFIGQGIFSFAPKDRTEQQQIGLFCKKPALETSMQTLYIRGSETLLKKYFGNAFSGTPEPDAQLYEKAVALAQDSDRNAFGVRLLFSEELWFPRLQGGDLYSEMNTGLGKLVYQHAPEETEDILLADKDHDRIVSLYSSRGPGKRVVLAEDFRVLSYKMNLKYDPGNLYLAGIADVLLMSNIPTSTIVFKLNQNLRVTQIEGNDGSLLYFQEKNTNNLHVVLGSMLDEGAEIQLRFKYEGKIPPDRGRSEMQVSNTGDNEYFIPPTYLYSNQAMWYPQLSSKPYSQVDFTISVPAGFAAIANGTLTKTEESGRSMVYSYSADLPVKYFSMLVGRLQGSITHQSIVPIQVYFYNIDKSNAVKQAAVADKMLRFYTDYFGRYPYRNLNLALRPAEEPGGHAPAGIVIANRVYSYMKSRFERDPLYIPAFPDFLLAHEVAHQWWGQAVGWRGYRDQWLSEGFAQFAATEYIRSIEGDKAWLKLSEEFRDWIEEKSPAGPIVLGTRLGHLTQDPRAYSALMYNKGAYVLNMLKQWLGPEEFQKCLAEFYSLYQFKRAGIDEFIVVAQRYSAEDLTPFFKQWLEGWTIPHVDWNWRTEAGADGTLLKLRFVQTAEDFYQLKIPVEARDGKGQMFRVQALVNSATQDIEIPLPFEPVSVAVDPLRENLAEYQLTK